LKKRSKKLLSFWIRVFEQAYLKEQKFFGSFFQKRTFLSFRLRARSPWHVIRERQIDAQGRTLGRGDEGDFAAAAGAGDGAGAGRGLLHRWAGQAELLAKTPASTAAWATSSDSVWRSRALS
jgi:hypothetical protein